MKIIKKSQAKKFTNSDKCIAYEYPLGDKDINGAVVEIKGRYPDKGRVMNKVCKELAFVLSGTVKLNADGKEVKLGKGDEVLIEVGEKYYWHGKCRLFIGSVPAWYPKQHRVVD